MTEKKELSERQANRMLSVFAGMVSTQRWKLRQAMAGGKLVTVNSDRPARWTAAERLVELGFAKIVRQGPVRIAKGPIPEGGKRRVREVMVLAWNLPDDQTL